MRRLRILAFCDFLSPDSSGGSEKVALEVYSRLADAGHEILAITALPTDMAPPPPRAGLQVEVVRLRHVLPGLGIQVHVAPGLASGRLRAARDFAPDVIHANGLFSQTSLAAAGLHLRGGWPLVTTIHIAGLAELPQPARALSMAYEHSIGRWLLAQSHGVLAVSEPVRDHVISLGTSPGKVAVVPNGVDPAQFHPPTKPRPDKGPMRVVFVGRMIANKGPQTLLEALLVLDREGVAVDATFVGSGPLRESLQRRAGEAGLLDKVRFPGHLDDVSEALRSAQVCVRPSLTEGMPLTVLEAMASRVCVVLSDIPANAALINHEQTGLLFPPSDGRKLADVLSRLAADPRLRRRLAAAGEKAALHFSWDRCASLTADALARAATPRGGAR